MLYSLVEERFFKFFKCDVILEFEVPFDGWLGVGDGSNKWLSHFLLPLALKI